MVIMLALLLVTTASLAGLVLSSRLPWSRAAQAAQLDRAVGVAMGPFLLGLAVVLVLWLLPGRSHLLHLVAVLFIIACPMPWALRLLRRRPGQGAVAPVGERVAAALLGAFALAMLFDLAFVPLIQNDALEYATVGRILFDARDLAAYPAIDPQTTASGFFGPWTHPPLYVALIYLADIVQGQAESGQALRWIAPWFLAAGALCIFALGRIRSTATAVIAAIIFVSTPILFLGATSALIDPLPVLGMALAFAALVGIDATPARRGAALGLMLGLALWTHSQAILFPCLLLPLLLLQHRAPEPMALLPRFGASGRAAGAAVLVALLVGGAPYLRNLMTFGSPISDNPAVFAYAPLGFADYFRMQRGISDPVEIIQYGVLKGFFSIEAYSVAFWLALLGVAPAARAAGRRLRGLGGAAADDVDLLLSAALGVVIMYTGATAVSAALGIDLMIKNERYMLVLIPCIAVLGGAGLTAPAGAAASTRSRWRLGLLVLVLAMMPAQLLTLVSYRQSQLRGDLVAWNESEQLTRWPHFEVMRYLRDETPPNALVLSMKPADMFYAGRRMVSYLDPRLLPFYAEAADDAQAWQLLRSLGISHVHMTDYLLPPAYMSRLMSMVTDTRYAALVSDAEGYQIYELRGDAAGSEAPVSPVVLDAAGPWQLQTHVVLGGRKSRARFVLAAQPYDFGVTSINDGFFGLFHRESGRVLMGPAVNLRAARVACPVGRPELVVRIEAAGKAQIQLLAVLRDAAGQILERRILGDRPALQKGVTTLLRRMPLPPAADTLALVVEHRGASQLRLDGVSISVDCPGGTKAPP